MGEPTATGGSGHRPVIAVDAMGGDRAPREIVAGACAAPPPSSTSTSCSSDSPTPSTAHLPAGGAARRGRRCSPRSKSSPWTTSPRRGPHQEGLVARPRRAKRCATGGPRRWSAPATRAPRWRPRCCAWAASAACTGPRSRCPLPVSRERALAAPHRRRRDGRSRTRVARASGPVLGREYAKVRLGIDEPTVALLSNGEEPGKGDDAAQGRVRAARRSEGLHRQRRRPRPPRRCGRRHRHRRVHRQRRAEDRRRRAPRVRRARVRRASTSPNGRRSPTR